MSPLYDGYFIVARKMGLTGVLSIDLTPTMQDGLPGKQVRMNYEHERTVFVPDAYARMAQASEPEDR